AGHFLCVSKNQDAAASSKLRSASRQRVKFATSESEPSGRLIRYIRGHFASGRMVAWNAKGLVAVSASLDASLGKCAPSRVCEAVGRYKGVLAASLALQSRFRCAAIRHRGLQKRAVARRGLNFRPQAEQAMSMMPLMARACQRACECLRARSPPPP